MYENGWGVDRNNSAAVEWYREAAEEEHVDAQYRMDGALIEIIQQQYNGIAKQQRKAMLMLNIILDGCIRMDGALIEII